MSAHSKHDLTVTQKTVGTGLFFAFLIAITAVNFIWADGGRSDFVDRVKSAYDHTLDSRKSSSMLINEWSKVVRQCVDTFDYSKESEQIAIECAKTTFAKRFEQIQAEQVSDREFFEAKHEASKTTQGKLAFDQYINDGKLTVAEYDNLYMQAGQSG